MMPLQYRIKLIGYIRLLRAYILVIKLLIISMVLANKDVKLLGLGMMQYKKKLMSLLELINGKDMGV
jgi:hypothetical protein